MDLVIVLIIGLAVGAALGWLLGRNRTDERSAGEDPAVLRAQHAQFVAEVRHQEAAARSDVSERLAEAEATVRGLREQIDAAQLQYREIIERNRQEMLQRSASEQAESKVLRTLAPVQESLRNMQQSVAQLDKQRSEQHGELAAQVKATRETAEKSKLAAETLAAALKNNSVRGAYGETQLKSLVESAGLIRRVDFTTQESIEAESGPRRPDMVVHLPGGKQMAVDAKVPYAAFIESNRPDIADVERTQLLTQHAKHVKIHIDALAGKSYWTGLTASPEFTVAFIPNESILNSALDADPGLMEHAFAKGVLLATPVNLWAILKTIAFTWQQDVLTENAKELFDLGNELYARLAKLSEHVSTLGRSIESTVKSYNQFVGSLERRVLVTARKFDRLDEAKVLGEVKQIDSSPERLTADEFTAFEDLERPELELALEAEIVDDEQAG